MAEQRLNTRIISKHITLQQANEGTWKPYEGEIVLARVDTQKPDGHGGVTVVPTYLMKVGAVNPETQELYAIKDLQWTHAPASDVYAWAKQQKLAITDTTEGNVISNIEATDAGITITRQTVATSEALETANKAIEALEEALGKEAEDRAAADEALDNKITAINENLDGTTEGGIGKRLAAVEGVASDNASNLTDYKAEMVETLKSKVDVTVYNEKMSAIDAETADIRADFAEADTAVKTELKGASTDGKDAETIYGAKAFATAAVAAASQENATAHEGFTNKITALEEKVKNVTNVMDFVGIASSVTVGEDNVITIVVDGVDAFQKGDVVVSNDGKEYVYDGAAWHEFGYADDTNAGLANLTEAFETFRDTTVPTTYATKTDVATDIGTAKQEAIDEAARLDGVQYTKIDGEYKAAIAASEAATKTAYEAADAATLQSANSYTDEEIDKVEKTIADLDAAYKAADVTINGRIDTLDGEVDTLAETVADNKADVDTNFVKVVDNELTINGNVIIFDCGGVEEA